MSNKTIQITRQDEDQGGKLIATVDGHDGEGEMTWSGSGGGMRIVDHTGVPDSLRGLGVGVALAKYMVAEARKDGVRLYPLCPFFLATAKKNPDWSDVVDIPKGRAS